MKKIFIYVFCIVILFSEAGSSKIFAQRKNEVSIKTNKANTAKTTETKSPNALVASNSSLSEIENQILDEINGVRQNPNQYADYLEDISKYYKDKTFTFPDRVPVLTIEGTTAIDDAVANLRIAKPSGPLKLSETICRATRDHAKDLMGGAKFGHKGSDGSMPDDRLARYMDLDSIRMGENVVVSRGIARDLILQMLVDDGVPSRAHRRNLLDPEFQFIGISSGEKSKDEYYNVFIFTTGENSKKNIVKEF